jgi:flagellar biosynthetic protein FlhB
VLAIADYAYQRWRFMRSMRMSKEEIKEEFKRSEGDPSCAAASAASSGVSPACV